MNTQSKIKQEITTKVVGLTTYVTHRVESMGDARRIADTICTQSMLPVYFGTGYAVERAHIQRVDYGSELVLRFFPNGEARDGLADGTPLVHSFVTEPRAWPTEKQLQAEADALEAARH